MEVTGPYAGLFVPLSTSPDSLQIGPAGMPTGVPVVVNIIATDGNGGSATAGPFIMYYVDYDINFCPNTFQSPDYAYFRGASFLFDGDVISNPFGTINFLSIMNADATPGSVTVLGTNASTFDVTYSGVTNFPNDGGCPEFSNDWEISRTPSTPSGTYTDIVVTATDNWGNVISTDPYTFTVP